MRFLSFMVLLALCRLGSLQAQDTLRVLQYNLLYYGYTTSFCTNTNNNVNDKDVYLRTIVNHLKPDIFAVNELGTGVHNMKRILDNVLNTNGVDYYQHATYTNIANSSIINALYFDSRKFTLYREAVPNTVLRDINLYTLYYNAPDLHVTRDTVFVTCVVAHLKAGSEASDQQTRTLMVRNTMNYLNNQNIRGNVLFMGDFNMKSSYEEAYQLMINPQSPVIQFFDPINAPGSWYANRDFALHHTQSTRTGSQTCFASGGMDDRFDFILTSGSMIQGTRGLRYLSGSYRAVGQDGKRYRQSLISPANTTEPSQVINALYNLSDHLPVLLKMITVPVLDTPTMLPLTQSEIWIANPVQDKVRISFPKELVGPVSISLISLSGQVLFTHLTDRMPGDSAMEFSVSNLRSGMYIVRIQSGEVSYVQKVVKP